MASDCCASPAALTEVVKRVMHEHGPVEIYPAVGVLHAGSRWAFCMLVLQPSCPARIGQHTPDDDCVGERVYYPHPATTIS